MTSPSAPRVEPPEGLRDRDGLVTLLKAENKRLAGNIAAWREGLAQTMIRCGLASGHGDDIADLIGELEWQVKELRADRGAAREALDAKDRELCRTLVVAGIRTAERDALKAQMAQWGYIISGPLLSEQEARALRAERDAAVAQAEALADAAAKYRERTVGYAGVSWGKVGEELDAALVAYRAANPEAGLVREPDRTWSGCRKLRPR